MFWYLLFNQTEISQKKVSQFVEEKSQVLLLHLLF